MYIHGEDIVVFINNRYILAWNSNDTVTLHNKIPYTNEFGSGYIWEEMYELTQEEIKNILMFENIMYHINPLESFVLVTVKKGYYKLIGYHAHNNKPIIGMIFKIIKDPVKDSVNLDSKLKLAFNILTKQFLKKSSFTFSYTETNEKPIYEYFRTWDDLMNNVPISKRIKITPIELKGVFDVKTDLSSSDTVAINIEFAKND